MCLDTQTIVVIVVGVLICIVAASSIVLVEIAHHRNETFRANYQNQDHHQRDWNVAQYDLLVAIRPNVLLVFEDFDGSHMLFNLILMFQCSRIRIFFTYFITCHANHWCLKYFCCNFRSKAHIFTCCFLLIIKKNDFFSNVLFSLTCFMLMFFSWFDLAWLLFNTF